MTITYTVILLTQSTPVLSFRCADNQSIFRAARRAGIEMSAGCMQGRCQICRAVLSDGTVKSLRPLSPYATVDPAAMPDNNVLPCSVVPTSDVSIAPRGPWRVIEESKSTGTPSFQMLDSSAMPIWD
ncbi:MAG: 2Fe-2S iron-sulfur cluster-binding protein [Gammaproteobacteria bacterium]